MGAPAGNLHNAFFKKDTPYTISEIMENRNPFSPAKQLYKFEEVKLPLKPSTGEEMGANYLYFTEATLLKDMIKFVEAHTIGTTETVPVPVQTRLRITTIREVIDELMRKRFEL